MNTVESEGKAGPKSLSLSSHSLIFKLISLIIYGKNTLIWLNITVLNLLIKNLYIYKEFKIFEYFYVKAFVPNVPGGLLIKIILKKSKL